MGFEVAFSGHPLLGSLVTGLLEPLGVSCQAAPTMAELVARAAGKWRWQMLFLQAEAGLPVLGQQLEELERLGGSASRLVVLHGAGPGRQARATAAARCQALLSLPLEGSLLVHTASEVLGLVGRRRAVRVPANLNITFEDFRGIFIEQLRDLSATGMFIEMERPLEVGTPLQLSCELPDPPGGQVAAWAKVVRRVLPGAGEVPGIGVRFVSLEPGHRRRLQKLAEDFEQPHQRAHWPGKLELNAWPSARQREDDLLKSFDRELRLLEKHREQLVERLQQYLERELLSRQLSASGEPAGAWLALLEAWGALTGGAALAGYLQLEPEAPARLVGVTPDTSAIPAELTAQQLRAAAQAEDIFLSARNIWPDSSRCLAAREPLPGERTLLLMTPFNRDPELASTSFRLLQSCAQGLARRLSELASEPGRLHELLAELVPKRLDSAS